MRVSIIIVNWNGLEHLPDCLSSLESQSYRDFEVILVDNGSSDGSLAYLQSRHPWVQVVALPENRGFAGGNNAGLARARGAYIVTLNNDTKATPTWLSELVAVADAHPEAGMVASRICNYFEPDRIDSLGFGVCRDGMSRGAYRGRLFPELSIGAEQEILFPSACVALYRREMLDEIGFFDADFFAYCEDTDLGLRARLAGWGALLARDAVIYHKYSMTSGAFSPLKLYLVERNHYFAALKNFPLPLLLLVPFFTVARYLTQVAVVLKGAGSGGEFLESASRSACIAALLRGMRDAAIAIPTLLRKRAAVMQKRRLGTREMMRLLGRYRMSFRELLDLE
jgi:GT2 family glycosyltransferase